MQTLYRARHIAMRTFIPPQAVRAEKATEKSLWIAFPKRDNPEEFKVRRVARESAADTYHETELAALDAIEARIDVELAEAQRQLDRAKRAKAQAQTYRQELSS